MKPHRALLAAPIAVLCFGSATAAPSGLTDSLDGAFSKLKIPQDKASKMVPTVTDLVGTVGGNQAKSMLSGALK